MIQTVSILKSTPYPSGLAIVHKLNNFNKSVAPKPFSEYDPESIFPPPSQISVNNNDNESEKSKSNNFVNAWKRSSVIEVKEEISFGSKY